MHSYTLFRRNVLNQRPLRMRTFYSFIYVRWCCFLQQRRCGASCKIRKKAVGRNLTQNESMACSVEDASENGKSNPGNACIKCAVPELRFVYLVSPLSRQRLFQYCLNAPSSALFSSLLPIVIRRQSAQRLTFVRFLTMIPLALR